MLTKLKELAARFITWIKGLVLRYGLWTVVTGSLLVLFVLYRIDDAELFAWKSLLVTAGGPGLGLWIDRIAFPYGRPDKLVDPDEDGAWSDIEVKLFNGACLRRVIIMSACILALASGV